MDQNQSKYFKNLSNSEYPNGFACGEPVMEANGLTEEENNINKQ